LSFSHHTEGKEDYGFSTEPPQQRSVLVLFALAPSPMYPGNVLFTASRSPDGIFPFFSFSRLGLSCPLFILVFAVQRVFSSGHLRRWSSNTLVMHQSPPWGFSPVSHLVRVSLSYRPFIHNGFSIPMRVSPSDDDYSCCRLILHCGPFSPFSCRHQKSFECLFCTRLISRFISFGLVPGDLLSTTPPPIPLSPAHIQAVVCYHSNSSSTFFFSSVLCPFLPCSLQVPSWPEVTTL